MHWGKKCKNIHYDKRVLMLLNIFLTVYTSHSNMYCSQCYVFLNINVQQLK